MNGLFYRLSQKIKETGERLHSRALIALGLAIKELALETKLTRRKK